MYFDSLLDITESKPGYYSDITYLLTTGYTFKRKISIKFFKHLQCNCAKKDLNDTIFTDFFKLSDMQF